MRAFIRIGVDLAKSFFKDFVHGAFVPDTIRAQGDV